MAGKGAWLICLAVLGVLCAWTVNVKVPEGFHEPWKFKITFTVFRLFSLTDVILEKCLGYESFMGRLLTPKAREPPASIHQEEAFLAGVRTVIYRPAGNTEDLPTMVYYHGGGWVMGSPEFLHYYCVDLVEAMGVSVISVDYRLAPEHPYPVPFEDCYKVAEYVMNNAVQLKVDPKRISLGGDSAGGNLAAAVATKFRDEGKADKIKMQLLLFPVLQAFDFQTVSYQENGIPGVITAEIVPAAWTKYALGKSKFVEDMTRNAHVSEEFRKEFLRLCGNSELLSKRTDTPINQQAWTELKPFLSDPYFCPLVAKDLTNMPPSVVVTIGGDVLRDEGILYAQRLRASGVTVVHHNLEDSVHGICAFKYLFPVDYQRAFDTVLPDVKKLM